MVWVLVAVLIGVGWIGVRLAGVDHGPTSLLSDGPIGPAHPLIVAEFHDPYESGGPGFDGAQFYAIARSPFDVKEAARYAGPPTYRLRRILYPAVAWAIAPGGGARLIWAMAFVSLIGVAVGAWALLRLPGSPGWLSLAMVINPGIVAGLWLSLGDVLATGLVLAAFATMFSRRVGATIVLLVLAALTREISLVAAFALMTTPGLTRRDRVLVGVLPCIPVGLWSLYVAHTLDGSFFEQPGGGTFTVPFSGWMGTGAPSFEIILIGLLAFVLALSLTTWRTTPWSVTLFVAVSLAMLVCSSPVIMRTWVGSTRVVAAAFPLAIWAIVGRATTRRRELSPTFGEVEPVAT